MTFFRIFTFCMLCFLPLSAFATGEDCSAAFSSTCCDEVGGIPDYLDIDGQTVEACITTIDSWADGFWSVCSQFEACLASYCADHEPAECPGSRFDEPVTPLEDDIPSDKKDDGPKPTQGPTLEDILDALDSIIDSLVYL